MLKCLDVIQSSCTDLSPHCRHEEKPLLSFAFTTAQVLHATHLLCYPSSIDHDQAVSTLLTPCHSSPLDVSAHLRPFM